MPHVPLCSLGTHGWVAEETGNMSLSTAFSTASKPRGVTAAWLR